jgi:hypothetical protein
MKMKRSVIIAGMVAIAIGVAPIALFSLSVTHDAYVCHQCKGFGSSTALRAFRHIVVRTPIHFARSLTGRKCTHKWEWYFANSHGLCFNSREDWDGPIGTYPYLDELERQQTENNTSEGIRRPADGSLKPSM